MVKTCRPRKSTFRIFAPALWDLLQTGFVAGAMNLPLSTLRKRMSEVPDGKKLYVYCQVRGGAQLRPCGLSRFPMHSQTGPALLLLAM